MEDSFKQLTKRGYQVDLTEDTIQHSVGPKLWKRYEKLRKHLSQTKLGPNQAE